MKRIKNFVLKPFKWAKHAYQRVRYGFSYRDIWNIDTWFLEIVPNMLEKLAQTTHSYPYDSKIEEEHKELSHSELEDLMVSNWKEKLKKMAEYLREANEPQKEINQYEDELFEFENKHNVFFVNVEAHKEELQEKLNEKEFQEYKELREKWFKRLLEVEEYKRKCLKNGLEMFVENFQDLWD